MKLEIDRAKWLRGELDSKLLRERDQKMCCLGFYSLACGLTKDNILEYCEPNQPFENAKNLRVPTDMKGLVETETEECELADGSFRTDTYYSITGISQQLMRVNDDVNLTDAQREARITQLFAEIAVEVSFK